MVVAHYVSRRNVGAARRNMGAEPAAARVGARARLRAVVFGVTAPRALAAISSASSPAPPCRARASCADSMERICGSNTRFRVVSSLRRSRPGPRDSVFAVFPATASATAWGGRSYQRRYTPETRNAGRTAQLRRVPWPTPSAARARACMTCVRQPTGTHQEHATCTHNARSRYRRAGLHCSYHRRVDVRDDP